jgi:REP element-mobilizing transposase RayT
VFSRGSNRRAVVVNDRDYVYLEAILLEALVSTEFDARAWSFMPNHWHGVFCAPAEGLSRLMRLVNHRYSLRFNKRWNRRAHLWENRFGAVLQQTEAQCLWTLRYVVRNPVDAGMCRSPEEARWTSYPATVGLRPAPPGLRVDQVLRSFDPDPDVALSRYRAFICED